MSVAALEQRVDPGQVQSLVLALLVHVLLAVVLVFGVRWQNKPPESVSVELWEPPVAQPPPVEVKPAPPPPPAPVPVAKPEPVIEKPDIAVKAPPKKPEPKKEAKPPPTKPAAKAEPPKVVKPPSDAEAQRRLREELAREQASLAVERERNEIKDRLAREASAASARALASWAGKVTQHIKSRVRKEVADAVPGNPEAVFMVTLLPSFEVLNVKLLKSSGNKAYDEEVERAILRASPLPRPDKAERAEREFRLSFYPRER